MRTPLIIGLAVTAAVGIACSTGTPSSKGDPAVPASPAGAPQVPSSIIGGTLNAHLINGVADITLQTAEVQTAGPNEFEAPKGEYVVVSLLIACKSDTCSVNPLDFVVVSPDSTRVQSSPGWFDPALNALDVPAGQQTAGKVTFDVPKGSESGSKIAVTDGFKDVGYWVIG